MNFVERKFLRQQNLVDLGLLWNRYCAAIHDAVDGYNKRFSEVGEAVVRPIEGKGIQVEVDHKGVLSGMDMKRRVNIVLERTPPAISVTIDAARAKKYPIKADEERCFLTPDGRNELSLEDFADSALSEPLFTKKILRRPTLHRKVAGADSPWS